MATETYARKMNELIAGGTCYEAYRTFGDPKELPLPVAAVDYRQGALYIQTCPDGEWIKVRRIKRVPPFAPAWRVPHE